MLPLNTHIGHYRLIEFLGMGGMGEVYRAVHTRINRVAALKVLSRTDHDPRFVQRLLNEARIQASLHHPNIVTLYDCLEFAGTPCLVMEYVDGTTLAESLRLRGSLPLAEAAGIFRQVVEAVSYVHDHGVVHRDIKSSNIKINAHNEVKLLDFGIARDALTPDLTRTGHFVGTIQYLAPEQVVGATTGDQHTDIWALGVLLYEMVTAQLPFAAETVSECMKQITSGRYPAPEVLHPTLPREVQAMLHRCLRKKPAHRYATARELLQDVALLAEGVVQRQPGATPASSPRPMLPRLRATVQEQWPLWVSGGALVGLIMAGVFLTRQPSAPITAFSGSRPLSTSPSPPAQDDGIDNDQPQQWAPVRINTQNGTFDVYQHGSRVTDTPWQFNARVGSHVRAVLKREGFQDVAIDVQVKDHGNDYTYTPENLGR